MSSTWYSLQGSWLAEFWTLLHLPYTFMAICFVLAGFALNKPVNWFLAFWISVAYFLGLGIAAHSFDQLPGMGTVYVQHIKPDHLVILGTAGIIFAIDIGAILIYRMHLWILLPFMILQAFFAFAYPMAKLFNGRFHTDHWFAVGFGLIPFLAGYWVSLSAVGTPHTAINALFMPMMGCIICYFISLIEIQLSRFVRHHRNVSISPEVKTPICVGWGMVEQALKTLCLVVYFSTLFLLLW